MVFFVNTSIQPPKKVNNMKWNRLYKESKKRVMKESYEVSEELADRLNSVLADEFLAN